MQKRFKDSMNSVSKLTKKTNTFYYSYTKETEHSHCLTEIKNLVHGCKMQVSM